jgi:hypothetical protein
MDEVMNTQFLVRSLFPYLGTFEPLHANPFLIHHDQIHACADGAETVPSLWLIGLIFPLMVFSAINISRGQAIIQRVQHRK